MNCPNCNTYNPEDKTKCWHCGEELPRPVQKKQKQPSRVVGGLPVWTWVLLGILLVLWTLFSCSGVSAPS